MMNFPKWFVDQERGQGQAHQEKLINNNNSMRIKAVVSLAPLTDLTSVARDDSLPCHQTVSGLLGGSVDDFPQRYKENSPLYCQQVC